MLIMTTIKAFASKRVISERGNVRESSQVPVEQGQDETTWKIAG